MGIRMRHRAFAVAAAVAMVFVANAGAASSYRIIVHPGVRGTQIPRATLSSIFLKRAPRWADGAPVLPVDQSLRSRIRQSFAADVLQRPILELQVFWARSMSTGVTPPPVKQSDEEIVAFVASTPGSIGYVSSNLPLPESVREVAVIE